MVRKLSTANARRDSLSLDLARWLETDAPEETRTVLFRLSGFTDPKRVAKALEARGATTETVSQTVIVGRVAQKDLKSTLGVKGVLSIEASKQLVTTELEGFEEPGSETVDEPSLTFDRSLRPGLF